jgi:hypothetical protein
MTRQITQPPQFEVDATATDEARKRVSFFKNVLESNPGSLVDVLCGVDHPDVLISNADSIAPDGTPQGDALAAATAVVSHRDYHYFNYDTGTHDEIREYVRENGNLERNVLALGRLCVIARRFSEFYGPSPDQLPAAA